LLSLRRWTTPRSCQGMSRLVAIANSHAVPSSSGGATEQLTVVQRRRERLGHELLRNLWNERLPDEVAENRIRILIEYAVASFPRGLDERPRLPW
jgi:hypothetical protein